MDDKMSLSAAGSVSKPQVAKKPEFLCRQYSGDSLTNVTPIPWKQFQSDLKRRSGIEKNNVTEVEKTTEVRHYLKNFKEVKKVDTSQAAAAVASHNKLPGRSTSHKSTLLKPPQSENNATKGSVQVAAVQLGSRR